MTTNIDYFKTKLRRPSKSEATLSSGDAAVTKKPSFFTYCRHEPVILMHHLFIGGFGFLFIVVSDFLFSNEMEFYFEKGQKNKILD